MPDRFGGFVVGFEEHVFGVGRPPEAVVAVHFFACGEFRQSDFPFAVLRCRGDHRNRVAGFFIVGKIHVHQIRAGGVHDVPSVGTDARVQHRFEFIFLYRDGSRRARRKVGEEKLPVDGEGHAVAGIVDAIRDDAGSAFARTFASRLLFRRNVFRVGVGKQYARIGERNLTDVAVFVDHAHPQRGDGVFRTVGTQEQRAGAVCNHARRTRSAAGKSQGTCFFTGELSNRICHAPNLAPSQFHLP